MAITTTAANALAMSKDDPQLAALIQQLIGQSGGSGTTTRELALKESQYGQTLAEQIRQFNEQMAQRTREAATGESQYKSNLAQSLLTSPYAQNEAALSKLSQTLGYPLATPTTGTGKTGTSSLLSTAPSATRGGGGSNLGLSDTMKGLSEAGTALDKLAAYDYNVPGLAMETSQMRRDYTQALGNIIRRLGLA